MVNDTNKSMVEFMANKENELPTYILKKKDKHYSINIVPVTIENIADMRETLICLENYTKPVRPMSSYKVDELIELGKKVGIYNEDEKLKKPELYEKINEYLKWK